MAPDRASLMRHAIVALIFSASCLLAVGIWLAVSGNMVRNVGYDGRLTVMLPWHWGPEQRFQVLIEAGAVPVRETIFAGTTELGYASPAVIDALEAAGAWLIVGGLPVNMLAVGGCSYLSFQAYDREATLAKLRAGPM